MPLYALNYIDICYIIRLYRSLLYITTSKAWSFYTPLMVDIYALVFRLLFAIKTIPNHSMTTGDLYLQASNFVWKGIPITFIGSPMLYRSNQKPCIEWLMYILNDRRITWTSKGQSSSNPNHSGFISPRSRTDFLKSSDAAPWWSAVGFWCGCGTETSLTSILYHK